jgi:hypothetical protein
MKNEAFDLKPEIIIWSYPMVLTILHLAVYIHLIGHSFRCELPCFQSQQKTRTQA